MTTPPIDNQRSELEDLVEQIESEIDNNGPGGKTSKFVSDLIDAYVAAQVLKARRDEIGCVQSITGRFNVVTYIHSDTGMTVSDRFLELEHLTAKEKPPKEEQK